MHWSFKQQLPLAGKEHMWSCALRKPVKGILAHGPSNCRPGKVVTCRTGQMCSHSPQTKKTEKRVLLVLYAQNFKAGYYLL